MPAAQYETPGPAPGEIRIVELERPVAAPGEVLVRVSGVNPTDIGSGAGRTFDRVTSASCPITTAPARSSRSAPGEIVAVGDGEIVAVGDGVAAERIGERVWLYLAQWRRSQGTTARRAAPSSLRSAASSSARPTGNGCSLGHSRRATSAPGSWP